MDNESTNAMRVEQLQTALKEKEEENKLLQEANDGVNDANTKLIWIKRELEAHIGLLVGALDKWKKAYDTPIEFDNPYDLHDKVYEETEQVLTNPAIQAEVERVRKLEKEIIELKGEREDSLFIQKR